MVSSYGRQCWFLNGERHRIGGPAIIDVGANYQAWYIEGKQYTEEKYNNILLNK